jgi:hypothetical protein
MPASEFLDLAFPLLYTNWHRHPAQHGILVYGWNLGQIRVREICRQMPFSGLYPRIFENPSRICLLDKSQWVVLASVVMRKRW